MLFLVVVVFFREMSKCQDFLSVLPVSHVVSFYNHVAAISAFCSSLFPFLSSVIC